MEKVIWIAIAVAFIRGLFVFDQGGSAISSYPTASAICFVGAILSAVLMVKLKND
jgi:membrane-associated PAP2 superfamily phosphatase